MAGRFSVEAVFKAVDRVTAPVSRMQNRLGKMTRSMERGLRSANRSLDKFVGSLASAGKSVLKFGTAGVGVLTASVGLLVREFSKVENAEAAFTPLLGGAERARQAVDALNETAASTPFQFETLASAANQLLPVMNGNIEDTVKTLRMLGDTAGGNAQKLDSITRGFTKAMLKGKVDMESLNMIAEAGVPIFGDLAEVMGTEVNEAFFKMISAGKVTTTQLTKAFEKMTSKGGKFFNGMEIASKTTSGLFSTLKDNISLTAAELGGVLAPTVKELIKGATEAAKRVREWVKNNRELISNSSEIKTISANLLKILVNFAKVIGAVVASTIALKISMIALNTVLFISKSLISAYTAVVWLANKSGLVWVSTLVLGKIASLSLNAALLLLRITGIAWAATLVATTTATFAASAATKSYTVVVGALKPIIASTVLITKGWVAALLASKVSVVALSAVSKAFAVVMATVRAAVLAFNIILAANPIGAFILAVGLLIGAGALLVSQWGAIKSFFIGVWDTIDEKVSSVINNMKNKIASIIAPFKSIVAAAQSLGEKTGFADLFSGGGDEETQQHAGATGPQIVSPQDRVARSIEEKRTKSTAEVTIKDETGRAELTDGKLGTGLSLQPTGAF